ncbi:ATP-dependent zinc metalloprotease FtsH [Spiroplasma cantharicola]|uniref:ATP-dependent zinc metalloprotease FtsH n=1 Tax=Spiroplasma cantharicola TaxID=362837 RepID=A0A0M4JIR8_9MOLU|nr:ATP-dependent zinc metalloprotease FtsH [Spiroplasma cantharicola]ALD65923.1 cell division protein FtsH [Spiroplasma cantharicola]
MKKKKSIWLWVLFIVMLIVIGIVIWQFIAGTSDKLTEAEFLDLLMNNKISKNSTEQVYSGLHIISGSYTNSSGVVRKFVLTLTNSSYTSLREDNNAFKDFTQSIITLSQGNSPFMTLIINLLPMVILIGFYIWIFSSMSKGGMGGGMFGPGKNTRPREIKSDVKFSDVAGINEEKIELVELVDYLKNPNKYALMGARVPKGVLMEGPPGTGKTLLAKAVAGEAGVAFFSMAGSEFEEMFVGLGASRVRDLFSDAKKAAPCIIFIDEIDAVGRKRSGGMGASTNEQTLNQLLVEMDGFASNTGVIVMAATNRVDVLDSALLRPGRFDRTIQISLPDIREREAILKLHSRNKSVSPEIDWKRIAERTPGFSGAQLENVLNEAAILVVRDKRKMINILDIDEAIDRVVGGPAKKSRAMTMQDKQIVSYHEAGHALMGLRLESASKVQKVTIIPRGNAGGYTIMTPKDESNFSSKEDLFASIAGYLGGRAAEEIMFGKNKITTGAHDDLDKATNIARRMVTQFGMSTLGLTKYLTMQEESYGQTKGVYSDEVAFKIDTEINTILEKCYKTALEVINKHKDVLELIAESLRVLETITAEQIDYIDKHNKLPKEVIEEKNRKDVEDKKKESGEILEFEPDEDDK